MPKLRQQIPNDEVCRSLEDKDNRAIINTVKRKYNGIIDVDDLESGALVAVWRTLQYCNPALGSKFTTSLYKFLQWEFRKILQEKNTKKRFSKLFSLSDFEILDNSNLEQQSKLEDIEHIKTRINFLPSLHKRLIKAVYLKGKTLGQVARKEKCSVENVRKKVKIGLQILKSIV